MSEIRKVDVDTLRHALLRASCSNVFYLPLVTKIDIFGRGYEPFDESEFERRASVALPDGRTLVVKSPEDTVRRKLRWYRAGGEVSERQWRDVGSVLRVSGARMDASYLALWAERLGVAALLERARRQ